MKSRMELLRFMNLLLFQQFAAANVEHRHHNKHHRGGYENDVQHDSSPVKIPLCVDRATSDLEFNHDRHIDKRFISAKIRKPNAARAAATRCFRQPEALLPGCVAITAGVELGRSVISSRRCDPAAASPIRHTRVAIIVFPAKSDVLLGHIVKRG